MKTYRAAATKVINARPEHVYRVVSDMHEHKNFLPKEFEKFEILKGGIGAGTVFRIHMNVMGTTFTNTLTVSEPEPGRVLCEVDPEAGVETQWTFTPADGGSRCQLTVESQFRSRSGFGGVIERVFSPGIIRRLYHRELALLDAYAQKTQGKGPSSADTTT
jgi:ribosome-associated toxin RatA of RatAB toxin-antitoxin module